MSFDEWFGKNIDYLPYGEAIKLLCKSAWEHQQQRLTNAEQLLADAQKALEWWNNGQMQQRLALKDREIMRLREALEEIVKKENTEENEWDAVEVVIPAMCAIAKQALSTPTTYDDLMAWHEAQLGEPLIKVIVLIDGKETVVELQKPLYAKKG